LFGGFSVWSGWAPDEKDDEIAVLRHQLVVLRRQVARFRYTPTRPAGARDAGEAAPEETLGGVPGHAIDCAPVASRVGAPPLDLFAHGAVALSEERLGR
jgi:hypothetical protein